MNKKVYLIIGGLLIVALLAGGAFMAMRLLNARGQNTSGAEKSSKIKEIPAPEVPTQDADLSGRVISVKDNSLFVAEAGLDNISVRRLLMQPTPPGPYTEVVVSKDTKIYRDATYDNVPTPSANSSGGAVQQIQQKMDPVDISAVPANSYAQVWGQRRGNRVNADIIVVLAPVVVSGAGGQ
jgi:hypothetical protein